ncbi:hypothetical protein BESB_078480 [Besnoitia besnoiti]|uniref:Uncharacterized protein n=1 Tax=Besnoitia besnoiti TaxID=94643 RepID=A0A2A9ME22_BESBE|nr:hypothetical protein BESB_078480 [Besnoitia besnoiti]PFH33632.1 hypothetical protein BESB_078480 [Besnoitia besnoiti]
MRLAALLWRSGLAPAACAALAIFSVPTRIAAGGAVATEMAEDSLATTSPEGGELERGASPRRLMAEGLSIMAMQYIMVPEMRDSLVELGTRSMEIFKGLPTYDLQLDYYHDPQDCVVVFDTLNDGTTFGLMREDEVTVTYSHVQHQGLLDYVERRRETVEVLKGKQRHLQKFNLPRGCIADETSYWVAYCRSQSQPCYVGRIDIHLTKGSPSEKPMPLEPISYEAFAEQLVDKEGMNFYDVEDIFEAETPPNRLTWDTEKCLLHYRYSTNDISATSYYWMRTRHAFRIDVKDTDGKFIRKMSAMIPDCGGEGPEDFTVTYKEISDGTIKAVFRARRLKEFEPHYHDTITLKKLAPHIPVQNWDPEDAEVMDFVDLFPETDVIALDMLTRD